MRLWETVADRSVSLSWPWTDGADSATLVFSNRVTRTLSCVQVERGQDERGQDETHGSCAHPVVSPAAEALVDATIVQKAGGEELSSDSVVLAYVAGAGGGPIVVRAMVSPERELARLQEPRVYAFDTAWQGEPGESGYDIAWPQYTGLKIILR